MNTNTQAGALDSTLFSFTPGVHKLVTITATAKNPSATPAFALQVGSSRSSSGGVGDPHGLE